jgi:DNA-binding CsgD family transcriptional regulator
LLKFCSPPDTIIERAAHLGAMRRKGLRAMAAITGTSERLKLGDVRRAFRLVGEIREIGSDPKKWRPHMVLALRKLVRADVVVSSEIHFRKLKTTGRMKVVDIGWGSEPDGKVWQINTEREDEQPENFWLAMSAPVEKKNGAEGSPADEAELVPVRPTQDVRGGKYLILSQYALPHAGVVDQLGLHRAWDDEPFTTADHKLVRLFHVELGRLWKRDAIRRAKDPATALPPRLTQTLNELLAGSSEKQIAAKLDLSRHTIHNYVKALHQRFGVSSRGELLARCGREQATFTPKLSMELPKE